MSSMFSRVGGASGIAVADDPARVGMSPSPHPLRFIVVALTALVTLIAGAVPASAQVCEIPVTVDDEAGLNDAIACFNAETSGSHLITVGADITLTASTTQLGGRSATKAVP